MHTIVTHSGSFHSDDVFAIAAFQLLLGIETLDIIRTRDEQIISTADYVVDVGGVYDHTHKRYDHHQIGAPVRDNGIPYSGFGLVWKHYGSEIAKSEAVAAAIDKQLVQAIDAGDNGISLYTLRDTGITPVELHQIIGSYAPAWGSEDDKDKCFMAAVDFARAYLTRTIKKEKAKLQMEELVESVYNLASDKRILEFDVPIPMSALISHEDVEVVLCPDDPASNDNWVATCVRKRQDTFESRVSFPEKWAGLRNTDLQNESGISDAIFCHKARFLFVAASKESALQAAQVAA